MNKLTLLPIVLLLPFDASSHDTGKPMAAHADASSNYVVKLQQMTKIEAGEGELIHLLRGEDHGFKNLSFILTETAPGGGPPLHTHESEEAHVLMAGTMSYIVGAQHFTVSAPYVLRVPANTPHTFVNAGTTPLQLTAVFDSARYTFKPLAPNPLQAKAVKSEASRR